MDNVKFLCCNGVNVNIEANGENVNFITYPLFWVLLQLHVLSAPSSTFILNSF
jgi:hypothetical protein